MKRHLKLTHKYSSEMVSAIEIPVSKEENMHYVCPGNVLYRKVSKPDYNSNRAICIYKIEEMWNAAFKEHQLRNPQCEGILLCDLGNEEKRGFGTRQQLICTKCDYKSKRYTLYEELESGKPGRKASKLDTAIHVGLSQSPIAYSGIQKIFLSGNILAPTTSSLQRRANTVMKQIEQINKQDMKRRRNDIVEINKLRGKKNPHAISVQMDGMYNNPLYSGVGRTPFQPATQTIYTAAENETSKHNILALNIKNKLCSKHSSLDVDNDSGRLHEDCTDDCSANIPMVKSIGDEYTWARECLLDLKEDQLEIEHLKVMPATTKLKRQKLLNNYSVDLTERCNRELLLAYKFYTGDFCKVKNKISHTVDAIAYCYMGDHARCRKNSFACKGFQGSWLKGRPFLPNSFNISSCNENLDSLRKQINKRLGSKVLEKTRLNMNTNFVEGFNRCLRRSLPSNVTFKKNMSGRAHAAAHSVNNGPGESILELCSALHCDIPVGKAKYIKSCFTRQEILNHIAQRKEEAEMAQVDWFSDIKENVKENDAVVSNVISAAGVILKYNNLRCSFTGGRSDGSWI
ncbi:unnamed protein product [Mytilus edulis]|uniref:Mutator-like transposase domain-containing protein n=1 Tax=Mytilus edulis TaxID=6550 RepID=A0A8S3RBM4_MYTED|nr:unnamed protein product [Mytilus edulis]